MISNKKIGITGHSRGIGKALYDALEKNNDVCGFSKTTGCNLLIKEQYDSAIEILKTCDIIINNAYNGDHRYLQTDLFYDFIDNSINDENKLIINIGSMSKYIVKPIQKYNRYASSKVLLDDAIDRVKILGHKCGIINVAPNWVRTQIYEHFKEKVYTGQPMGPVMEPNELAEQIINLIDLYYNKGINVYYYETKKIRI